MGRVTDTVEVVQRNRGRLEIVDPADLLAAGVLNDTIQNVIEFYLEYKDLLAVSLDIQGWGRFHQSEEFEHLIDIDLEGGAERQEMAHARAGAGRFGVTATYHRQYPARAVGGLPGRYRKQRYRDAARSRGVAAARFRSRFLRRLDGLAGHQREEPNPGIEVNHARFR